MEHFLAVLEFLVGTGVLLGGLAIIRSGKVGLKRLVAGVCLLAGAIVMVIGAGDWVKAGTQPAQIQKADNIAPASDPTGPVSDTTAQAVVPETPSQIAADFNVCIAGRDLALRQAPETLDCSTLDCSNSENVTAKFDDIVNGFSAVAECIPNDKFSSSNMSNQIWTFRGASALCKHDFDYVKLMLKRTQSTSEQMGDGDEQRSLRVSEALNRMLYHTGVSGRCAAAIKSYHDFLRQL